MNRIEIETKLNRDRAWLLEQVAALPPADLTRGVTPSEHDPTAMWSAQDHLAHLAGIESRFNEMIRKQLDGDPNPVGRALNAHGAPRTRAEIIAGLQDRSQPWVQQLMAGVHTRNEEWVRAQHGKPLSAVVAVGQQVRAETLALLASLSDEQLASPLAGAPWADGTIGGVIAVNGDHARRHMAWVQA
ncbi:MAG: DinB family protein, partial [Chloroflexota bacterium]